MRMFVCYLFFLIMGCLTHVHCTEKENAKVQRAKKVLQGFEQKSEELRSLLDVPGAAIGIVVDGEVVYSKGIGKRELSNDLPMTPQTLMPIGSATKSFTTFLIGQLVDEGLLHWDDPIIEHIHDFRLADPYITYEVTIRDYLTHITGYSKHDACWFGAAYPRSEMIKRLRHLQPAFGFREQFCYTNLGYMVAGHAAERATNKSWEELLQEYILNPLEMYDTTTSLDEMKSSADFAHGYRESDAGVIPTHIVNAYTIGPAGSMNSNVEDLLKWTKLLLQGGKELILPNTFKEITKPQVVSNILLNGKYGAEDFVTMEAYGLGWIVLPYRHHPAIMHGGNIEGFSSNVFLLPKEKIGIVVLTNKNFSPLPYLIACEAADRLLGLTPVDWVGRIKQYHKDDTPEYYRNADFKNSGKVENTTPSHQLEDFTGIYQHPAYGAIEFTLNGEKLEAKYNTLTLYFDHWHYDSFAVQKETNLPEIEGLKISFRHNFYGEIDSVVIPFEPDVDDLIFIKKKSERLFEETYLNRFLGIYSYLGIAFNIKQENGRLKVEAAGQPPFVLTPEKDELFSVIGYDGYTVQFLKNEDEEVTAVQLIQPNNTTFTAYKTQNPD